MYVWDLQKQEPWAVAEVLPGTYSAITGLAFQQGGNELAIEDSSVVQYFQYRDDPLQGNQKFFPITKHWPHKKTDQTLEFKLLDTKKGERYYQLAIRKRAPDDKDMDLKSPSPYQTLGNMFSTLKEKGEKEEGKVVREESYSDQKGVLDSFSVIMGKYENQDTSIVWNGDGSRAVSLSQGRSVAVFDVTEYGLYIRLAPPIEYENVGTVTAMAISPNGAISGSRVEKRRHWFAGFAQIHCQR